MPRNSVGTYTLPQAPFVPNTVISSSVMNSDLSDIASALTTSVASTGVTSITAPIKFFSGTVALPGISWVSEPASGWYRIGTGDFGFSVNGTLVFELTATGPTFVIPIGTDSIADLAVTNAKIAFNTIALNKLAGIAASCLLGNPTVNAPFGVQEITIAGAGLEFFGTVLGVTYATKAQQEAGGAVAAAVFPSVQQYHPSAAKAWVNFTDPGGGGTCTINASYNVSSVTRNGTGDYTVNFTVPFSSANYCATVSTEGATTIAVTLNKDAAFTQVPATASAQRLCCLGVFGPGSPTAVQHCYYVAYGDQ